MKVEFKRSFTRDLKRVRDKTLKRRVGETIELVEQAESLQEVENVKKLGGDRYYRIRIGGLQTRLGSGRRYRYLRSVLAPKGYLQALPVAGGAGRRLGK